MNEREALIALTTALREVANKTDTWMPAEVQKAYDVAIAALAQPAVPPIPMEHLSLNVRHKDCHRAADAFWEYWNANGETHKHGYYESTWGAINRALRTVGVMVSDRAAQEQKP